MNAVRRTVAVSAAVALAACAAPALAAAESYHESRQDHLIHVVEGDFSSIKKSVASITSSVTSLSSRVTTLSGQVAALSTTVTNLQSQVTPEYGLANLAVTDASANGNLPTVYSANVPRDGIDPALATGGVAFTCNTGPCTFALRAAIRSSRPTPTGGKAAGQIGGGIDVTNTTTGALVAAVGILPDGKHSGGQVPLLNIGQVPVASVATSTLTSAPFTSASAVLNDGASVNSSGELSIPNPGTYLVSGTFYFYDFDNAPTVAAARDRTIARGVRGS